MAYRYWKHSLAACTLTASAVGAVAVTVQGCSDDPAVAVVTPDASNDVADLPETSTEVDSSVDGNPLSSPKKWAPTAIAANLKPQPSPKIGGNPGFTIPFLQVANPKFVPVRMPDVFVDSPVAGGVGLGCKGYKFAPADPRQPTGPNFPDGDMGNVTINGYTGGFLLGPMGPTDAGMAKPITCKRAEIIPGSGIFNYGCDGPPGPTTGFIHASDTVVVAAAGGSDIPAWSIAAAPPANENLSVTTDLWSLTPAQLDGSADLVLNYDCQGPCTKATNVGVVIQTTDGTSKADAGDAGGPPATPFDFPNPKASFGLVQCTEFAALRPNSITIPKEVLKVFPANWTDMRVVVLNATLTGAQAGGEGVTVLTGQARFGIIHR